MGGDCDSSRLKKLYERLESQVKKYSYIRVDEFFLKIYMHLIISYLKIIIEKDAFQSSTLQVRKWLCDGIIMKMLCFAFHNLKIATVINNIEKSPLLGQGQHLFTLLKDH